MVQTPLFTIATVCYNAERWIRDAIESILASSYVNFELLLADDCSSDRTWEIIQSYRDPRITAWRNEPNLGEYPNRNAIINRAKGNYLLFVDGDDMLYKHTLRNLAEYIDAFPEAGMIWGVHSSRFSFAVLPYLFTPSQMMELIYGTNIPLANIGFAETVFKTDVLRQAGGLSDRFAIGDTYIKKKLAASCPTLLVPLGMVFWRQTPTQASMLVRGNQRSMIESFQIDCEILASVNWLERPELRGQVVGSFLRRLIRVTIMRGHVGRFWSIVRQLKMSWRDFLHIRKKYVYFYSIDNHRDAPLKNTFHF